MNQKLHEAVTALSGLSGVNAATITAAAEKFICLLSSRWEHICDVALSEENEGTIAVGFSIKLDMGAPTPRGEVTLSFSQRARDGVTFTVEDPNQLPMPLSDASGPYRPARPARRRPTTAPSTATE